MLKQTLLLDSSSGLFPTQHPSPAWTILDLLSKFYNQEHIGVKFHNQKGEFVLKMQDLLLGP